MTLNGLNVDCYNGNETGTLEEVEKDQVEKRPRSYNRIQFDLRNMYLFLLLNLHNLYNWSDKKKLEYLDERTFFTLYKPLIRSLHRYGNTVWKPYYKKYSEALETLQRRHTKFVLRNKDPPYPSRLKVLQLPTLIYLDEIAQMPSTTVSIIYILIIMFRVAIIMSYSIRELSSLAF